MPVSAGNLPPLDIPALLRLYGLRPDKRLGQNFLQDGAALEKISATANPGPEDVVLEIGPGLGSLTRQLARTARLVIGVEIDAALLPALKSVTAMNSNVRIIQGDILEISPAEIVDQPGYLVAANIPYYITSAILRHLLESEPRPRRIVLTLQKEVAERICAGPGDLSLLALSVQVYGEPQIAAKIPAQAFYPPPKVDSAVLSIEIRHTPLIPPELLSTFFHLTKAGFAQKRKTLRNSLAAGLHITPTQSELLLKQADIDPMRRAETLNFPEWERLCRLRTPE